MGKSVGSKVQHSRDNFPTVSGEAFTRWVFQSRAGTIPRKARRGQPYLSQPVQQPPLAPWAPAAHTSRCQVSGHLPPSILSRLKRLTQTLTSPGVQEDSALGTQLTTAQAGVAGSISCPLGCSLCFSGFLGISPSQGSPTPLGLLSPPLDSAGL